MDCQDKYCNQCEHTCYERNLLCEAQHQAYALTQQQYQQEWTRHVHLRSVWSNCEACNRECSANARPPADVAVKAKKGWGSKIARGMLAVMGHLI